MRMPQVTDFLKDEEDKLIFEEELFYLSVAEKIAQLMYDQGVSKAELAKRMKVKRPYITKILSGEANLTIRTLYRIFYHMGYKVDLKPAKYVAELDYSNDRHEEHQSIDYGSFTNCYKKEKSFYDRQNADMLNNNSEVIEASMLEAA